MKLPCYNMVNFKNGKYLPFGVVGKAEVDKAAWYSFDEAARKIADASLAETFLLNFLAVYGKEKETFWQK